MIFLDTDVLIAHQRGSKRVQKALQALVETGETLATTSINVAELFHGAERSQAREAAIGSVLLILDRLVHVPFGPRAARRFGTMMASLHKAGTPMPDLDGLVAAVVLENGGRLITGNRRHFERLHGIELLELPESGD